jgi:aryl-alcohol dehydrogenase-like predicted oxidoreductase
MLQRQLGKNGPIVSAMGLGCMGMSEFYGVTDTKEAIKLLNHALDDECNFWDTADMYGAGLNEVLLSRVLCERRDEVFLCTKFGNVRSFDGSFLGINGKPEYVKRCCDASLMRLGVDTIDLYYQHRVDLEVPIEDTVGAMSELVQAGKVKYLGLSESGPKTIRRAYKVHPITAGQYEYSLWTREIEAGVLPTCRELGITLVAYSPLGRGFLTGEYKEASVMAKPGDARLSFPRFQGENFERNLNWLKKIETLAAARKCTPAQLALAWLLAKGEDIIPIPGTRKITRLHENLAALEIDLTEEEMRELNLIGEAAGKRYPDHSIGTTMRESK